MDIYNDEKKKELRDWFKELLKPDGDVIGFNPITGRDDFYYICRKRKHNEIPIISCPNFKTPYELQGKGLLKEFLEISEEYCRTEKCAIQIEDFSNDRFFLYLIEKRGWTPIYGTYGSLKEVIPMEKIEKYKNLLVSGDEIQTTEYFLEEEAGLRNPKAIYIPLDLQIKFFVSDVDKNGPAETYAKMIQLASVLSVLAAYGIYNTM